MSSSFSEFQLTLDGLLEAGTEPGLGLSTFRCAFSRPVLQSCPPAPAPPGPSVCQRTPAENKVVVKLVMDFNPREEFHFENF